MKKLTVFVTLLVFLIPALTKAQESKDFRFTVKTNPLAALGGPLYVAIIPITGEYKVMFEARTAAKQSVETGFSYLGPSVLINLDELTSTDSSGISGVRTNGFRFQVGYRFFLTNGKAPEGFYVGPHVSFAKARITNKDNTDDYFEASKANVNLMMGYQLITGGGFTLNFYTGLGVKVRDYSFAEGSNDTFDFDTGNRVVASVPFGFSFGYAF
jgi:hypothetical protein